MNAKHGLTPEQTKAMEPLLNTAKSYLRKINDIKRQIASDPTMDYDKSRRIHNKLSDFEIKYTEVNTKINDIANARDIYQKKLDKCKKLLGEADEMKKKWGF